MNDASAIFQTKWIESPETRDLYATAQWPNAAPWSQSRPHAGARAVIVRQEYEALRGTAALQTIKRLRLRAARLDLIELVQRKRANRVLYEKRKALA